MNPMDQHSFEVFMQTGKIQDYLNYCDTRASVDVAPQILTGEQGAYFDRWNYSAGAAD